MRKPRSKTQLRASIILLLVLPACAAQVHLSPENFDQLSPLKVGRQKTPEISDLPASALAGFLVLGSAGVGFAAAMAMEASKREPPIDFGELVMNSFVERAGTEIPWWPAMTIEEEPLSEDYVLESGTLLEFEIKSLIIHFLHGLTASVTARLENPQGDLLWQKRFLYSSRDFDRIRSIDEFKADNNKLLKEELKFAVDKTVSDFIAHLKGEQTESYHGAPVSES